MKERLKELRKALGLSQQEFSERINVAQSTYAHFETGRRELRDIHISQICTTFNVREELLPYLTMNKEISVMIPALGKKDINVKIYYIRDMGSYATWRSTKATGSYDSRTFQIKARPVDKVEGLRPGMSAVFIDPENE